MIPEINIFGDEHFVVINNQLVKYTGEYDVIIIPEGIENICKGCFEGNINLKKITLPNSLRTIGRNAFFGCSNLSEIVFGEKLINIEARAFMACTLLKSIALPTTLRLLGEDIFKGTGVVENESNWHSGMLILSKCVFEVDNNTEGSCVIPNECRVIAQYAFNHCKKIESIYMPNSIITIGKHAFENCISLKHIQLSDSLTDIPKSCFKDCGKLLNVEIPTNVRVLRKASFVNCTSLRNIIIPDNVCKIYGSVFKGCVNLKNIIILSKTINISVASIPNDIDATIRCLPNSSAQQYAISKNIKFVLLANIYTNNGEVNSKLSQKYISIINKIYNYYETVTDKDMSVIQGMCNRCIRHDQLDWKATWDCMGKPNIEDMKIFVDDAFPVRNELREFKFDSLLEFRQKYFNVLSLVYRNLSSLNITSEQYHIQTYDNDFVFDINSYYVIDGTDYAEVHISLIDKPIKKKICNQLNKAISELLVVGNYENIIEIYNRQIELLSDNFQSFLSKFNEYINFYESYLNENERILNACIEYAQFVEGKSYSHDEKYAYYYTCGVITQKRENYKTAIKFFNKAILNQNDNEEIIEQINKCEKNRLKLIQTLFIKFESGEQNIFDNVAEVKIEDNCIYIDDCLMSVDKNTTGEFYIKDFCRYIGVGAFSECKSISEIICPVGLKAIASEAFYCCEDLEKINIPETVVEFGTAVFSGCSSLKEISLTDKITQINSSLFKYCINLKKIEIPISVKIINEDAFLGCRSLKHIVIPRNVCEIKNYAFFICENLKLIEINSEKIDIGEGNFDNILEDKWYETIKIVGYENSGTDVFAQDNSFEFESKGVSTYDDFNLNNDILRKYHGNKEKVIIPDYVTVIGDEAFKNCSFIKEFVIPNNVVKICLASFLGCTNLSYITLPKQLKKIDTSAFGGCSQLKKIILPEGLKAIYENAFANCVNLKEITIPQSVKIMKPNIFKGCSSDLVIRGSLNSEAEKYADKYNIKFVELNNLNEVSDIIAETKFDDIDYFMNDII